LTQSEESFVLATVVRCERPTSAKPGARAIIQSNGEVHGWIGGSCAQPIVVRESLRLLRENVTDPYLLRLGTTGPGVESEGIRYFPMTCVSGGVLDIYMEPHVPQPRMLLIGNSPIASALEQLVTVLAYHVTHIDHADLSQMKINERTAILIATHGQYDEDALEQAILSPASYVGMVASKRRAETCREYLRSIGIKEQVIARLRAPAGLDIGAVTPEEIAASILAELVQLHRSGKSNEGAIPNNEVSENIERQEASVSKEIVTAIDPVCGMTVEIANARHRSTHNGQDFYFCCPACKRSFERDPLPYVENMGHPASMH
jgi:xanthine dehydrogenase accessory factor